jgi:hypothetical protein
MCTRVLYVFTVCTYMGKAPASTSKLLTPFVLCVCVIVLITCVWKGKASSSKLPIPHVLCACMIVCVVYVCMDEAPANLKIAQPQAWMMHPRVSACYDTRPHLLHVCVFVYAETRRMIACRCCNATLGGNMYLGTIQVVCVCYFDVLHSQKP